MAIKTLKWNLPEVDNYAFHYFVGDTLLIGEKINVRYPGEGSAVDYHLIKKVHKTEDKLFPVFISRTLQVGDIGIICKLDQYYLNEYDFFGGYDAEVINKFKITEIIDEAAYYKRWPITRVKGRIISNLFV